MDAEDVKDVITCADDGGAGDSVASEHSFVQPTADDALVNHDQCESIANPNAITSTNDDDSVAIVAEEEQEELIVVDEDASPINDVVEAATDLVNDVVVTINPQDTAIRDESPQSVSSAVNPELEQPNDSNITNTTTTTYHAVVIDTAVDEPNILDTKMVDDSQSTDTTAESSVNDNNDNCTPPASIDEEPIPTQDDLVGETEEHVTEYNEQQPKETNQHLEKEQEQKQQEPEEFVQHKQQQQQQHEDEKHTVDDTVPLQDLTSTLIDTEPSDEEIVSMTTTAPPTTTPPTTTRPISDQDLSTTTDTTLTDNVPSVDDEGRDGVIVDNKAEVDDNDNGGGDDETTIGDNVDPAVEERTLDALFGDDDDDNDDDDNDEDEDDEEVFVETGLGFGPRVDISIVENHVEILMAERKEEALRCALDDWLEDNPDDDPETSQGWMLEREEVVAQYDEDFMAAVKKSSMRVSSGMMLADAHANANTNTNTNVNVNVDSGGDGANDDDNVNSGGGGGGDGDDKVVTANNSSNDDSADISLPKDNTEDDEDDVPMRRDRVSTTTSQKPNGDSVDTLVADLMDNKREDYINAALADWREDHPDEDAETSESWRHELALVSKEFDQVFLHAVETSFVRLSMLETSNDDKDNDNDNDDDERAGVMKDIVSNAIPEDDTVMDDPTPTPSSTDQPSPSPTTTTTTTTTTPTPTPNVVPSSSSSTSSPLPSSTPVTGWFRKSQGNSGVKMGKILRYFVLDDVAIKYYANDNHTKDKDAHKTKTKTKSKPAPRGVILLSKQTQVANVENTVIIHTPTRTWKLFSDDQAQITTWVHAIVEKLKMFDRYALPVPETTMLSPTATATPTKPVEKEAKTKQDGVDQKVDKVVRESKPSKRKSSHKATASQEGVSHGTIRQGGGVGGFTNTTLQATAAARKAIMASKGKNNFVSLKINIEEMTIDLDCAAQCKLSPEGIGPLVNLKEPRYYLVAEGTTKVFIYCCPSDSTRKPRMLYSTGKKSAVAFVTSCKQKLSCTLEIQGPEDITVDDLRPSTASVRKRRAKAHDKPPSKEAGNGTSKPRMAEPSAIQGSLSMLMTHELGSNNTVKKKIVLAPGFQKNY